MSTQDRIFKNAAQRAYERAIDDGCSEDEANHRAEQAGCDAVAVKPKDERRAG